jgi:hypothetical protein
MVRAGAVIAGLALLVVGCGGGAGADGFTTQGGNDVARAATHDLDSLHSVRMAGALRYDGRPEHFDLLVDTSGDCHGTVSVGRARAELLAVHGQVWLKPNVAFFESGAPGHGKQLKAMVGDHWLVQHDTPLKGVCDLDTFVASFRRVASGPDPQATKVGQADVEGQQAVGIQGYGNAGETVTGWVATTGSHHLLKLQVSGGTSPGTILFSDFDHAVDAQVPDPSDVVDLSAGQG